MAQPYIYSMKGLTKVVPPSRVILKDIWLSFYPGAKIGVVGPNGAGKSSLLRIMAGVGQGLQRRGLGRPRARGSATSRRSRELDPKLDVRGNVEEAVKHQRDLLRRFEEVSMNFADVPWTTRR